MAILEAQFREDIFLDIIRAATLRIPIPSDLIDNIAAIGLVLAGEKVLVERNECLEAEIVTATLTLRTVPRGALYVRIVIRTFLTTYTNAKSAGHLNPPATLPPIDTTVWMRFALNRNKVIDYTVVDSDRAFEASGTLSLELPLPLDFVAFNTAILAGDGVVAVRMGTSKEDLENPDAFLGWWAGNRLGSAQWGAFIGGDVFAHAIATQLNRVAEQASATSSSPEIKPTQYATGAWLRPQRLAIASVNMNAIDAGPFGDVPFRIEVATTITPHLNTAVQLDTHIQWLATDTFADLGLAVSQNKLNAALADHMPGMIEDQKQIAKTDNSVSYRTTRYFYLPNSRIFTGEIDTVLVDDSGLVILGTLRVRPRPDATWHARLPYWTFDGDCHSKSVRQALSPPAVQVIGTDPYVDIYLMENPPKSSPLQLWDAYDERSMPGSNPVTLDVTLRPALRLLGDVPGGIVTSAWLYTNLGVRWIDFGTIPLKPEVNEKEIFVRTVDLISQCMAISDRWGMGVMNLGWLVDPPELLDPSRALREWAIAAQKINETDQVELAALGRNGQRRPLGNLPVMGGVLVASGIITRSDETLELRTGAPMSGPMPRVMQRWISARQVIPVERPPMAFALDGALLYVLHDNRSLKIISLHGTDARVDHHIADGQRLWRELMDRESWSGSRTFGEAGIKTAWPKNAVTVSIACIIENSIVLGVAAPFAEVVAKAPT